MVPAGESEVDHSDGTHRRQQQQQDSTATRGQWRGSSRRQKECIDQNNIWQYNIRIIHYNNNNIIMIIL
jgi:hypothetical protein